MAVWVAGGCMLARIVFVAPYEATHACSVLYSVCVCVCMHTLGKLMMRGK